MSSQTHKIELFSLQFIKATLVGGVLFLLPLVVLLVILTHAMNFASKVAEPVLKALPDGMLGKGFLPVAAVLMLIFVSFAAGLLARTRSGKGVIGWFEGSILGGIPQYQIAKSVAEGLAHVDNAKSVSPILVSVEGGWQLGYHIETLENGWSTVLLPQAPSPMSGNVMYMPADRIRQLDITMAQAMSVVKRLGVGSVGVLRGADLTLPDGA